MWKGSNFTLPSVLIVENDSGDVFIVENKKSVPQVEKILKTEPQAKTHQKLIKRELREPSPAPLVFKQEIKEEPEEDVIEEYLDEYFEDTVCITSQVSFVDPNEPIEEPLPIKIESTIDIQEETHQEDVKPKRSKKLKEVTFDGRWSSDEEYDFNDDLSDFEDYELLAKTGKRSAAAQATTSEDQKKLVSNHKMRNLSGKIACKYCDTIFKTRESKTGHFCKYLQCDPKNFVCRICGKELSRKTFSNHLHETLDCQYCGKQFVNPRNMKTHIENMHKGEKYLPPVVRDRGDYIKEKEAEEAAAKVEPQTSKPKIRYPRKRERFECDICGKYLTTLRSMNFHMSLHTGDTCYICENCGEKFFTPNGIRGHSCEKKRRRPEKDFRTYDMRYCRFCDSRFESYDENKLHLCRYQHPDIPKMVFCRCCGKLLNKLAFNRHMETHSGVDWICAVCDRKLATERALKVHMTTHSGNKPYKCKLCTETFINKVVLERHMRFHGEAPKTYSCEYCFKQLSTDTSLKSHVQRLHKQSAHCELCKAEFPNREDLKEHLLVAHEPSVCQVCSKSFTLPRYLKMHEKLHFEDSLARMQCPVCSKQLGMRNIKSHIYRHHPEQFDAWQQENPKL